MCINCLRWRVEGVAAETELEGAWVSFISTSWVILTGRNLQHVHIHIHIHTQQQQIKIETQIARTTMRMNEKRHNSEKLIRNNKWIMNFTVESVDMDRKKARVFHPTFLLCKSTNEKSKHQKSRKRERERVTERFWRQRDWIRIEPEIRWLELKKP